MTTLSMAQRNQEYPKPLAKENVFSILGLGQTLAIFGRVFERAKYGQVGCPGEDLAN